MRDERLNKLAEGLVNYSINLQKGEKVFIEATDVPEEVVCALVHAGAYMGIPRLFNALNACKELLQ